MKIIIAFLVTGALAVAEYTDIPSNPSFYENMINNKTTVNNLFDCLLETSPCDEFGTHVKGHMVESVKSSCKECGPMQKHFARIIEEMVKREEYKDYFEKLMAKYDPKGVYLPKLEKSVAGY